MKSSQPSPSPLKNMVAGGHGYPIKGPQANRTKPFIG